MSDEPLNFSWFAEDFLAGMAYPADVAADLAFLAASGVRILVNLTRATEAEERRHADYSAWAEKLGLAVSSLPVEDYAPPAQHQIAEFIRIVRRTREQVCDSHIF